jgi:RNA polymerase sigma factor (sigma-70 family)
MSSVSTTVATASRLRRPGVSHDPPARTPAAFERIYREELGSVSAYFARRSFDPQIVADLTSETFAKAIAAIHTYEARGTMRAWLLAIARVVYARHQEELIEGRSLCKRLAHHVVLYEDDMEELAERIDAQRAGRELLQRVSSLPQLERSAIELVDMEGMTSAEAANSLGISAGAMRVRLFRARAHVRKEDT